MSITVSGVGADEIIEGQIVFDCGTRATVMGGENSSEPVLDLDGALARLGGDKELFTELAGLVREDAPPVFREVRDAVAAEDAAAIKSRAHALKGLVAGCGGVRAAKAAQQVEDAGGSGNFRQAESLLPALEAEFHLFLSQLSTISA